MPTIVLEGWRFLPHSYALTAMALALELASRPSLSLFFRDAPIPDARWAPARGVLLPAHEDLIASLPPPPADLRPDLLARFSFPYDFSPSSAATTITFATAEYGIVPPAFVRDHQPVANALKNSPTLVATPSKWSRDGFLRSGVRAAQIVTLINAVDPILFTPPTPAQRAAARAALNLSDEFVLLHSSSLGWNKNVGMMLDAMLALDRELPRLLLLLKGMDALYQSADVIERVRANLPPADRDRLLARVRYVGQSMGPRDLAALYHAADAYVCPYLAEGFNMPALEAIATGLPVLATAGGSSDDFLIPDTTLKIASKVQTHRDTGGRYLDPNFDSYLAHIRRVVRDSAFRDTARAAGPAHVRRAWTWAHAADQLLAAAKITAPAPAPAPHTTPGPQA